MTKDIMARLNSGVLPVFGEMQFGTYLDALEKGVGVTLPPVLYVDGDLGDDHNDGYHRFITGEALDYFGPKKKIQAAINAVPVGGIVAVIPRRMVSTDPTHVLTDPVSYAETAIIPNNKPGIAVIGLGNGRVQGGLPQIRVGAGAVPMLTIRAPGCTVANLGFNGGGSTGGGILLDDDALTKSAFGTSIIDCHFKNCAVDAGDGRLGGAINWAFYTTGVAWQILIKGNRFYKNIADLVLLGAGAGPQGQDLVIENNIFSGPPDVPDVNLWLGGNGFNGLVIRRNTFDRLPALSAGQVKLYMILQGCTGILQDNTFGCVNTLTFRKAQAGTAAWVPATVLMAHNWGEDCTTPFVHTA